MERRETYRQLSPDLPGTIAFRQVSSFRMQATSATLGSAFVIYAQSRPSDVPHVPGARVAPDGGAWPGRM